MEFNATFFVAIISFLVFTFVMSKIFYAPLERIVAERKGIVSKDYEDTKNFEMMSDELLKNRELRLSKADDEAGKLLSDKLDEADEKSKNAVELAGQKSLEAVRENSSRLKQEKESAEKSLQGDIVGLAELISSKVLGFEIKIDDEVRA